MSHAIIEPESFRDHLSVLDEKGKRRWIYPRFQAGKVFTRRNIFAYLMLALLVMGPFLKIDGHPVFLFNVLERKFIVWGIAFFPQDFFLFGLAMLTFFVFIILFTSVFGRWWCGYACPQTIFMEFIFRRIEYGIEGDAQQRRQLDKSEWNGEKILKKSIKHIIFFFISFLISNIFLAYIIGIDELKKIMTEPITEHFIGFVAIIVFSGVFYVVFAFLREQVCIGVCPYGRLQGVLLDKDSMVVSYDHVRGEPRGKLNTAGAGDCIDCHLCVAVCPTGIDIRNGTQLECINCAACIDACNSIMQKVHRPEGLIRVASHRQIITKKKFTITQRMIGYACLWTVLITVLGYLVVSRPEVQTTILRAPGQLFQKQEHDFISNLYTVNLVNKSFHDHNIELKVVSPEHSALSMVGKNLFTKSEEITDGTFFIQLPQSDITNIKTKVQIAVYSNGKKIDQLETTFIGPVYKQHHDEESKEQEDQKEETEMDH
ncbi:MAG: cytochrome c oxidase accessory protein CcoG [Chitinophagales bacterium]